MKRSAGFLITLGFCAVPSALFGQQGLPDIIVPSAVSSALPATETIVANMVAQGQWNDQAVHALDEMRLFKAANPRFKQQATREVHTTFRAPDSYNSVVVKEDGSKLIRQRVFDPILDAEKEAQPGKDKKSYDILPVNYDFRAISVDSCGERKCYRIAISPKRKNKFLLEGFIWVDAEDYGIAKVQGSPSKKISFWVVRTQVTKTYTRVGKVWLTNRIESDSDIFIAGHSDLSIDYNYESIQADDRNADQDLAK